MCGSCALIGAQKKRFAIVADGSRRVGTTRVRQVRDLPSAGFRIVLELEVRRVACRRCGAVKRERLDFLADNPRRKMETLTVSAFFKQDGANELLLTRREKKRHALLCFGAELKCCHRSRIRYILSACRTMVSIGKLMNS